jgi:hypothetical protein
VRAELEQARRAGELVLGESGLRQNELNPLRYRTAPQQPGKTREQVIAELVEARLLGDLQLGESGLTQAEITPQRYAAVRAQRALQAQQMAEAAAAR